VKFKDDFTTIAARHGLQVKFFPANSASELPEAVLSMVNSKIDAVCQMGDNLLSSGISTLIKGVMDANLPYFEFNQRPTGTLMEGLIEIDIDYYHYLSWESSCHLSPNRRKEQRPPTFQGR